MHACDAVDVDTPTCSDCESGTCPNPILPNILSQKKLTSGYMGIFTSAKPKGTSANEAHSHYHKQTKELQIRIKEINPHEHNSHTLLDWLFMVIPTCRSQ